jgi:hypothetical protein
MSRSMPTPKQMAANRRNAKRSTGPKTRAGKDRASRNSLQHGIFALRSVALPWESKKELAMLNEYFVQDLAPQGIMERFLVEQIRNAAWRLERLNRFETGMMTALNLQIATMRAEEAQKPLALPYDLLQVSTLPEEATVGQCSDGSEVYVYRTMMVDEALAFMRPDQDDMARLQRYRTSIENTLYRALHELQRLQGMRRGLSPAAPVAVDIGIAGVDAGVGRRNAA